MNQIVILERALDRLRMMEEMNRGHMDADDRGDLIITISEMSKLLDEYKCIEYRGQIENFKKQLTDGCVEADGDEWNKWCQTPYTIIHGESKVTIENGSEVYEGILQLLDNHLKEID